jgi:hypothetical protein
MTTADVESEPYTPDKKAVYQIIDSARKLQKALLANAAKSEPDYGRLTKSQKLRPKY